MLMSSYLVNSKKPLVHSIVKIPTWAFNLKRIFLEFLLYVALKR